MAIVQVNAGDNPQKAIDLAPAGSLIKLQAGGNYPPFSVRRKGTTIDRWDDASKPDPVISGPATGNGITIIGLSNIAIRNVRLLGQGLADGDEGRAIKIFNGGDIVVEHYRASGYRQGITVEGVVQGFQLRFFRIHDNYNAQRKGSAGIFASGVVGGVLEHGIFHSNGWVEGRYAATQLNHNGYLHGRCGPWTVHNVVSANASSHGLQMRSGGDAKNFISVDNPIGISYGLVNGEAVFAGGVSGTIETFVNVGSRDIAGDKRGWAIHFGNIKKVVLRTLLACYDTQRAFAAILVQVPERLVNPDRVVGIEDLTIVDPMVWEWAAGEVWKDSRIVPAGVREFHLGHYSVSGRVDPPVKADLRPTFNKTAMRALLDHSPDDTTIPRLVDLAKRATGLIASTPAPTPAPAPLPPPIEPKVRLALTVGDVVQVEDLKGGEPVDVGAVIAYPSVAVDEVEFAVNNTVLRVEKSAPYAIAGDANGKAAVYDFPVGPVNLVVTCRKAGQVLVSRSVSLNGVAADAPPPPSEPDVPRAVDMILQAKAASPDPNVDAMLDQALAALDGVR